MHTNLCKNCEHIFQGNFCSNCGQKTNTKRLDIHYLYDELKYTFLHINNGLLFTAKQLLTRPGDMVREFINGKRVKHYKPILLVFVLAGISTILLHYNGDLIVLEKLNNSNKKNIFNSNNFSNIMTKYYTLIQLVSIPIVSICSWLAFRKWGYNYIENIIINSFATAQLMIIGILATPIKYAIINSNYFVLINTIIGIGSYGFNIWLYLKLYKDKDLGFTILRILLFLFYFAILFTLLIIIGVIMAFSLGYLNHIKSA